MTKNRFLVTFTLFLFASVIAPAGGFQLPPEVRLDRALLRAKRLIEVGDFGAAEELRRAKALALELEHDLELSSDWYFEHARLAFAAGLLEVAKESVTRYLTTTGRRGESYEEALVLLENVDRFMERLDAPDCAGQPEGTACWTELANQPDCYVWNNGRPELAAEWAGACLSGFAAGPGTLTWKWPPDHRQEDYGTMRLGQQHGHWVIRFGSGFRGTTWQKGRAEGSLVNGERNGPWILKSESGRSREEGPYVDDKRDGRWVIREPGCVVEVPYVNGEKHGRWVANLQDGAVEEMTFVNGEIQGQLVFTLPNGDTMYGKPIHRFCSG